MPTWESAADRLHASGARHILILSRSNAARGQIAEGIARALAPRQVRISSAGVAPGRVDPLAARALAELSVNIADQQAKAIGAVDVSDVDAVITLSEEDPCPPTLGGAVRVHWPFPDPAAAGTEEERLARYREIRNELRRRLLRVFARDAVLAAQGCTTTAIEPASGGDRDAIQAILAAALLPSRDVGAPNQRFIVARENGRIIGCAGLEHYGENGQVRSLAVDWRRRTAGLGTRLHERLLHEAIAAGVRTLHVITATAEEFFARHGYHRVAAEEVPPAIRASEEFRTFSPAGATSMSRSVR